VLEQELAPFELFASLSKREREVVGRFMDRVDVEAGRVLASEGSFAHEFFVIDSGSATVSRGDAPIRTLGPGDFFGEIALLEADRRTATVKADTEMRLIVMHSRDFHSMMAEAPDVAERVRAVMQERLAQ
jgi:CRP/FNR family transcriptional regulator, cyclic AMP receptor protein